MLGIGLRVDQNCACVCVSARAFMRVRKGLVLRVCSKSVVVPLLDLPLWVCPWPLGPTSSDTARKLSGYGIPHTHFRTGRELNRKFGRPQLKAIAYVVCLYFT